MLATAISQLIIVVRGSDSEITREMSRRVYQRPQIRRDSPTYRATASFRTQPEPRTPLGNVTSALFGSEPPNLHNENDEM